MRNRRIYIQVSEYTLDQLAKVAERERRDPRQQAAYLLEQAVEKAAGTSLIDMKKSDAGYVLADTGIAL